jgi:hypothetical protein
MLVEEEESVKVSLILEANRIKKSFITQGESHFYLFIIYVLRIDWF